MEVGEQVVVAFRGENLEAAERRRAEKVERLHKFLVHIGFRRGFRKASPTDRGLLMGGGELPGMAVLHTETGMQHASGGKDLLQSCLQPGGIDRQWERHHRRKVVGGCRRAC